MTAVQELKYLFDDILKDRGVVITWDTYIEQEKQQIIQSYRDCHGLGHIYGFDGEEYYNETYNK